MSTVPEVCDLEVQNLLNRQSVPWTIRTVKVADILNRPLDWTQVRHENVDPITRTNATRVDGMVASLLAGEALPPVILMETDNGLVLIDGNNRLAAFRSAKVASVDAYVMAVPTSMQRQMAYEIGTQVNETGPMHATDNELRMQVVKRYHEFGQTQSEIAAVIRRSQTQVSGILRAHSAQVRAGEQGLSPQAVAKIAIGSLEALDRVKDPVIFAKLAKFQASAPKPFTVATLKTKISQVLNEPTQVAQVLLTDELIAAAAPKKSKGKVKTDLPRRGSKVLSKHNFISTADRFLLTDINTLVTDYPAGSLHDLVSRGMDLTAWGQALTDAAHERVEAELRIQVKDKTEAK